MVSYGIWLTTALFGSNGFGIKVSAVLWSLGLNLMWARLILDMYGSRRLAFWTLLALNMTLVYQIYGVGPTPDSPLLLAWVGAIWAVWRATQSGQGRWWLLAGLFAGLGLVGKYSAVLLGPVVLLYLATTPSRLLALEPGSTLESISTWADEVRSPTTAFWHYLSFRREDDCRYDAMANCPGGNCVVSAIERQLKVLGGKGPDEDRLKALRYVAHFIADLHQPLHAGYGEDRGGNLYQVQAFGRGTNLHAVWDSALVAQWPGGVPALKASAEAKAMAAGNTDPAAWAEASCRIVASDGFYPAGHRLEPDYLQRWAPVLEYQLAVAARRLAEAINRAIEPAR